ncbi:MAG: type I-MYXAN CRISPR-associated Cas8a1/Cmx1 [Coleofasciculus sp. S288]|nr:type I-MYXAN CRISPR-associated Cas8a1/Cmx1 [Coleofasciculus sp. S288]
MNQYSLSLFDPNTLLPHRAGIAGLAIALSAIEPEDALIHWEISEDTVSLSWKCSDKEALEWLVQQAYQIQDGFLVASSLNLSPQGRYTFSQGVLKTFLQHSRQRTLDKTPTQIAIPVEENQPEIQLQFWKLLDCYYLRELKGAFNSKGKFNAEIPIKGHHLPGLVECFVNGEYKESPTGFMALLFLPLACSYYQLTDRRYALVIPEITNLLAWIHRRQQLSSRSYKDFRSPGASEAGLRLLLEEWTTEDLKQHRVNYCEVYQLGKQPWDGNQSGLKQAVYCVQASDTVLAIYQSAIALFKPKLRVTDKGESWLALSKVLPWIAENLVAGCAWYAGFYEFRTANDIYERKGLVSMTEHLQPHERVLFDAVQGAFSNYLRGQFKFRKDKVQRELTQKERFDEFESSTDKVVYLLQRPSTQQDFATALVKFLSRSRSKGARGVGREIYSWIHGSEWRKARDLAMLAVATYQGKGKDGVPEVTHTDEIANLPELEAETESEEYVESL